MPGGSCGFQYVLQNRIYEHIDGSPLNSIESIYNNFRYGNAVISSYVLFATATMWRRAIQDPIAEHLIEGKRARSLYITLRTMKAFGKVSNVQRLGFQALRSCSAGVCDSCMCPRFMLGTPRSTKVILDMNGIDTILDGMAEHMGDAPTLESGYHVLRGLALHNDNIRAALAVEKRVCIIIEGMERHVEVATLQQSACAALCAITSGENWHFRCTIVRLGGISAILDGMRANPKSSGVQFQGVDALCDLAVSCSCSKKLIFNSDCIPVVLEAMKLHPDAAHLQMRCCDFLYILVCASNRFEAAIKNEGGIIAVVAIAEKFHHWQSAARSARKLLSKLMQGGHPSRANAIMHTVMEVVD